MQPIDVAEKLYGFSLGYRAELTQSIQNPLLAVSILAAASATLLPNYTAVTQTVPHHEVANVVFYVSMLALVLCAAVSIVAAIYAISVGRYMIVGTNSLGDRIVASGTSADGAGNPTLQPEFSQALTSAFLLAAQSNEEINARRVVARRIAVWALYISSGAFVLNLAAFIYAKCALALGLFA